eukprot:6303157-Lingulodinium_polyedra.AAC.1
MSLADSSMNSLRQAAKRAEEPRTAWSQKPWRSSHQASSGSPLSWAQKRTSHGTPASARSPALWPPGFLASQTTQASSCQGQESEASHLCMSSMRSSLPCLGSRRTSAGPRLSVPLPVPDFCLAKVLSRWSR